MRVSHDISTRALVRSDCVTVQVVSLAAFWALVVSLGSLTDATTLILVESDDDGRPG